MRKKIILWGLVILCFGTIFILSGQVAKESNGLSTAISEKVLESATGYNDLPQDEQIITLRSFNSMIRNWAHFALFMFLGLFLSLLLKAYNFKKASLVAFVIAFCYAIFDETRQELLIDGRGFQMVDLYKDWAGSFVGIIVTKIKLN